MILYAPGNAPVASILLPDPDLGNSRGQQLKMTLRTSRNGNQYTYNRKNTDKVLTYTFEGIARGKVVELQEFVKLYQGGSFRITDHHDVNWLAFMTEATLDSVMSRRASPVLEDGSLTLTFTGRQL
jgi:hypothetical protein